jgi:hypothetical protein
MPTQNGSWGDQSGNLSEHPSTEDLAFDGQATSLVVVEQNAFLAQLFFEHLIFSSQVLDDVLLMAIDPTGQTDQEQVPGLWDEIHFSPDAELV